MPSASALPLATTQCRVRGRLCGVRCAACVATQVGEQGPSVDRPLVLVEVGPGGLGFCCLRRGLVGHAGLLAEGQVLQREAVGDALRGARGGSVRARHFGVVRTAGRHLVHFWENPVGLLRPLHLGRRGRPLEEDGILRVLPLRLVSGLGSLLFLLRALRGRRLLLQLLLLRLLPGNPSLLLLLLFFPRSWTWGAQGVPLLG